jgi:hypothetical protein
MNRTHKLAGLLGALLSFAAVTHAQDKPKPAETFGTPIRVQVVISEFDGDNKISNTPYTVTLRAGATDRSLDMTSLRVGIRMPAGTSTGSSGKSEVTQVQYVDVGTNIDCSAQEMGEKGFLLQITAERSSLYSETGVKNYPPGAIGQPAVSQPIMRQFRSRFVTELRDGQTAETTLVTDPLNGHIFKINVTLNVIK